MTDWIESDRVEADSAHHGQVEHTKAQACTDDTIPAEVRFVRHTAERPDTRDEETMVGVAVGTGYTALGDLRDITPPANGENIDLGNSVVRARLLLIEIEVAVLWSAVVAEVANVAHWVSSEMASSSSGKAILKGRSAPIDDLVLRYLEGEVLLLVEERIEVVEKGLAQGDEGIRRVESDDRQGNIAPRVQCIEDSEAVTCFE